MGAASIRGRRLSINIFALEWGVYSRAAFNRINTVSYVLFQCRGEGSFQFQVSATQWRESEPQSPSPARNHQTVPVSAKHDPMEGIRAAIAEWTRTVKR